MRAKFQTLVLIPRRLHLTDAARLMRLRPETLSKALAGRQYLTTEILSRIRTVFGIPSNVLVRPEELQPIRSGRVLDRVSGLTKLRAPPPRRVVPSATGLSLHNPSAAFGHVLGLAIRVEGKTLQEAAKFLSLSSTGDLSSIISGRRHITQLLLRQHQLLDRFKAAFPAGWARFGSALLACAARIPERRSKSRVRSLVS